MNKLTRPFFALSAVAALAVLAPACTATVTADPIPDSGGGPGYSDGRVTLRWTVDGSTNPNACQLSGVSNIRITIYSTGGVTYGSWAQDCSFFATSIDLPPGNYTGTAVLENGGGGARTTTISLDPFTIIGGSTLVLDIDFPADSFYQ